MTTSAIELLRAQYALSGEWLGGTMEGVTEKVATYSPPGGRVSPIAGQWAHAVAGLDLFIVNMVGGRPPLLMSSFAERNVVSEPPPAGGDWVEWGHRVTVNEEVAGDYAQAVFTAIDEILAGMTDADLAREVDFGDFGKNTVGWAFNIMLLNTFSHTGEISVVKGLQGLKGYPM